MYDDIDEIYNVLHNLLITVLDESMKQRVLQSYQSSFIYSELRNANGGIQTKLFYCNNSKLYFQGVVEKRRSPFGVVKIGCMYCTPQEVDEFKKRTKRHVGDQSKLIAIYYDVAKGNVCIVRRPYCQHNNTNCNPSL